MRVGSLLVRPPTQRISDHSQVIHSHTYYNYILLYYTGTAFNKMPLSDSELASIFFVRQMTRSHQSPHIPTAHLNFGKSPLFYWPLTLSLVGGTSTGWILMRVSKANILNFSIKSSFLINKERRGKFHIIFGKYNRKVPLH